jgi:hypothetical protein
MTKQPKAKISIVSYPKTWTPKEVFDVPPSGADVLGTKPATTLKECQQYVSEFNRCELEDPAGIWSVLRSAK